MKKEKTLIYQSFGNRWLGILFLLGAVAGCADAADQTNEDINSPSGGMAYIAGQMHAQGDDEGAMEFYARAIQRAPDDAETRAKLAELLEAHNDTVDAADQYAALVKLAPDNPDYRRGYGRMLIKQNRAADAKTQYEAALHIDGDDVRTLNGLGVALDLLGKHVQAQEQYKSALEQKPDDLVTLNNLGHSYILAGAYDEAIKLLEPQAANAAAPRLLRQNLAEAYALAGMDIDATRVLKMDLPPDQAKKKLAHYHAMRAKAPAPPLYANLGSFTTSGFAAARLAKIKGQFAADAGPLAFDVVPTVDEEGGEPIFYARASGFKDSAAARNFCDTLKKGGAFCKIHEG